jgi:hypothetical protein
MIRWGGHVMALGSLCSLNAKETSRALQMGLEINEISEFTIGFSVYWSVVMLIPRVRWVAFICQVAMR